MVAGKLVKMVQEGDVIDVPNPFDAPTVSGDLVFVYGWVGRWNEGGIPKGKDAPLIKRGVIEANVTAAGTAIKHGDKLILNTETQALTLGTEPDEGDADADHLVNFGKALGAVPANSTRPIWVDIKPQ